MASLSEFRAEHPEYDDMPDAALADALHKKFYSDIPRAEFDAMLKPQPQEQEDKGTTRGMLLPIELDNNTGEYSLAVPGIIPAVGSAIAGAVTLPGDVYSGETQIRDETGGINPDVIQRSTDLAGIATPLSAGRSGGRALAAAQRSAPLTEGQQVSVSAGKVGVELPRAITSDNAMIQQGGKILSNVPVAGTPLRNAAKGAVRGLDDAARGIQDTLGSGSRQVAGGAAREDLTRHITDVISKRVDRQYRAVDDLVDPAITRPLTATKRVASEIASERSGAALGGEGQALKQISEALARPEGLTYDGLKKLRTSVREMLDNPSALPAGTSQSELKRVYTGLTNDLRGTVAKAGGPKALETFNGANKFAATMSKEREALAKILGRDTSDEAIFERIVGMASGTTKAANINRLNLARRAASKETWNEIASASLERMGRAPDGAFSPERFLTSYGKMSPAGRRALFGRKTADSLDDIARVSTRFKQLNEFANPSGTAQNLAPYALGAASIADLGTTLGLVAGGNMLARVLAKPTSAKQVAQWATAYERTITSPSRLASEVLQRRSQALSLTLARESGAVSLAPQFAARLEGIVSPKAEDNTGDGPDSAEVPPKRPVPYDPRFDL